MHMAGLIFHNFKISGVGRGLACAPLRKAAPSQLKIARLEYKNVAVTGLHQVPLPEPVFQSRLMD